MKWVFAMVWTIKCRSIVLRQKGQGTSIFSDGEDFGTKVLKTMMDCALILFSGDISIFVGLTAISL